MEEAIVDKQEFADRESNASGCSTPNQQGLLIVTPKINSITFIRAEILVNFCQNDEQYASSCRNSNIIECHVMSEAIDKFFHRQIPVMKIMELLINLKSNLHGPSMLNHSEWLDNRAQVALKSTLSSRQDKIIALELIGASLHSYVEEYGFVVKFMS
ncbi:hypothetical protein DAPPUDRAFT_337634 [Daphnia pulex]|uniref:Uncharacterized protein n=1 Tax=Daphnia pulex TaxID=6669 RepID=E9I1X7_DAPPU|nr:hypothetical protein DAPPUDRAFT_337634 [Daphnia pulex]|eukprot:EFX62003.1 hypothetical protein DAPPUDRAFT_337634 [Daphnia pulex]